MKSQPWVEKAEFGLCRVITGHHWEFTRRRLELRGGSVIYTLPCTQCGSTRRTTASYRTGAVERRGYDYAKGYTVRLLNGAKKPATETVRHDVLHQLVRERAG